LLYSALYNEIIELEKSEASAWMGLNEMMFVMNTWFDQTELGLRRVIEVVTVIELSSSVGRKKISFLRGILQFR